MSASNRIEAKDRATWRRWLAKHHAKASEVWLVYYKLDSDVPSISYDESLEEALCFGWIDGIRTRDVDWLNAAKRPETQQKRLAETIELLNRKQKLGMK